MTRDQIAERMDFVLRFKIPSADRERLTRLAVSISYLITANYHTLPSPEALDIIFTWDCTRKKDFRVTSVVIKDKAGNIDRVVSARTPLGGDWVEDLELAVTYARLGQAIHFY